MLQAKFFPYLAARQRSAAVIEAFLGKIAIFKVFDIALNQLAHDRLWVGLYAWPVLRGVSERRDLSGW